MKLLIILVFCILVALGDSWIIHRMSKAASVVRPASAVRVVATRDLTTGWRLEPGDVALQDVDQRYITHDVKAGQTINVADLGLGPVVTPHAGTLLIATSMAPKEPGLNAGAVVAVCQGGKAVLDHLTARAKLCSTAGVCSLLVEVPADKAGVLAAFKTAPVVATANSHAGVCPP